jgi:hypothetical protein
MKQLTPVTSFLVPALITAGNYTETRFLEFFAANTRNPHTRRAFTIRRKSQGRG